MRQDTSLQCRGSEFDWQIERCRYKNTQTDCVGKAGRTLSNSILNKADTKYALKIKEAFHIGKQKPELNLQVKSLQVALVL